MLHSMQALLLGYFWCMYLYGNWTLLHTTLTIKMQSERYFRTCRTLIYSGFSNPLQIDTSMLMTQKCRAKWGSQIAKLSNSWRTLHIAAKGKGARIANYPWLVEYHEAVSQYRYGYWGLAALNDEGLWQRSEGAQIRKFNLDPIIRTPDTAKVSYNYGMQGGETEVIKISL